MNTNTRHPMLADYSGPDAGMAWAVHHTGGAEYCWSFSERRAAILRDKPEREWSTRFACMTLLLPADLPCIAQMEELGRQAEEFMRQAEELRRQAQEFVRQAQELVLQAQELRWQAEELVRQAQELRRQRDEIEWHEFMRQAEELRRQAEELGLQAEELGLQAAALGRSHSAEIEALVRSLTPGLDEMWDGHQLIFAGEATGDTPAARP